MANNGYDREMALEAVANDKADLIAVGRPFIANPDLPRRWQMNGPLNKGDTDTYYGGGREGFTDYPALEQAKV